MRKQTKGNMRLRMSGVLFFCMVICIAGTVLGLSGCRRAGADTEADKAAVQETDRAAWKEAEETPYGRYPETVNYTLGQMVGANNSNLPKADTYEDNAYTRYLKKTLNIQNEMTCSESEDRYKEVVDILIRDRNLPDVLVVSDREALNDLVENDLVEDLTEVYEKCASPRIKEMYQSYGGELFKAVEFQGRMMAVPETVIDHGPRFLWLRKDWMKELGLSDPQNLEDAFLIIEEFQKHRMGAADGEDPIGLVCENSLVGTTSSSYSVDPIFDSFGAHPQRWQQDANGRIIYGSLTKETKEALSCLHELYERGILDRDFALRAQNNLRDLVVSGKCGAFFGLWWTPNNPLMDGYELDKTADWEPYYFPAGDIPSNAPFVSFRDNKYVVVRKGYAHPEIVMKIISVLFDYARYEAEDAQEVTSYFALNVDPTARPLVINVDYNDATYKVTENIRKALRGEIGEETLSAIEKSYYDACRNYLKNDSVPTAEEWAAYKSRMAAVGLLVDADYTPPSRKYLVEGENEIPQTLLTLEKNTFIQMIMGKKSVEEFDAFVKEWYEKGGKVLRKD